jgi:hypothetical protein
MLSFCLAGAALAGGHTPTGPVILTVGGDLPAPNAPGARAGDMSFMGYLDLEFADGYAFDQAALAALEQHSITATLAVADGPVTWSGPRLSDVLAAAGAEGRMAHPIALDGYQPDLPWEAIAAHQPILATHGDGVPLGLGGIGPAMIVFPVVEDDVLYASFDAWQVWALFFIGVD